MTAPDSDHEWLDEAIGGYRAAQVIFTACRLRIFDQLGEEGLTAGEIARAVQTDHRATRILLDALVGLGLLEAQNGGYRNSPYARQYLVSASPHSRIAQVLHNARLYERWAGLFDSLKTGRPVDDGRIDPRLSGDRTAFARAMAVSARSSARQTAEALDLTGVTSVLDVGGGPGVYAIELIRRDPNLGVTLLDDAETLAVAEQNIRQAGFGDRIVLLPGDAFETAIAGRFDLVLVSNVIHIYSPDMNARLVERLAQLLRPGGRLVLKDFFVDGSAEEGRRGPPWNLLFAVNMLVATERGDCYSLDQVSSWCRPAGLELRQRIPLTSKSSLLCFARRDLHQAPAGGASNTCS